ncbi:MAG: sulfite exporter TauE/SafE family protein, partial [Actinomycetia bacterium]|nr:sulfite exporter TauE/SafE family protein [Actinomycetes bacterium]
MAASVPVVIAGMWVIGMAATDSWARVQDNTVAAVTMVFGSLVAGSTPQGGGAVAFPVFTKALDIPTEAARSFSLFIQTVGMGAATATIIITRRPVAWRAVGITLPAALVGFAMTIAWATTDGAFRPSVLPGPYAKVIFNLVVAAIATFLWRTERAALIERHDHLPPLASGQFFGLGVAGLIGGALSALVGSGADVAVYLSLAALFGLRPRVAVATSVVIMTGVSIFGFVTLGLLDRQLFTTAAFDISGMWLAAVPVVGLGAPLGAWFAARLSDRHLATLVVMLAVAELTTTAIFVEELRTDTTLLVVALVGLVVTLVAAGRLAGRRH